MANCIEVPAKRGPEYVTVLMDQSDYEALEGRKISIGSHGYGQIWVGLPSRVQVLHRWILGLTKGDGLIGDHINRNRLDNRRVNLRVVDPSGSSQNVSGRGKSRFRGVHPTRAGRWVARVKYQHKNYIVGTFDSEEDAAKAAEAKRREVLPFYVASSVL